MWSFPLKLLYSENRSLRYSNVSLKKIFSASPTNQRIFVIRKHFDNGNVERNRNSERLLWTKWKSQRKWFVLRMCDRVKSWGKKKDWRKKYKEGNVWYNDDGATWKNCRVLTISSASSTTALSSSDKNDKSSSKLTMFACCHHTRKGHQVAPSIGIFYSNRFSQSVMSLQILLLFSNDQFLAKCD